MKKKCVRKKHFVKKKKNIYKNKIAMNKLTNCHKVNNIYYKPTFNICSL